MSSALRPASTCFSAAMICASVCLPLAHTARMIGIFCQQPIAIFTHEGIITRIFT
jgi:hypothetical protein